jgi:hypothetical protein
MTTGATAMDKTAADILRDRMGALLMALSLADQAGDEITLDIVEEIASAVPDATDDDVFELGVFVRANLSMFLAGKTSFASMHALFTGWLLIAPLGIKMLRGAYCVSRSDAPE